MGNGAVGSGGGSFDPQLWKASQGVIAEGAEAGETGLTDTRLRQIVAAARQDGAVNDGERALLDTLADPQAGAAIYQRLRQHGSVPTSTEVHFAASPQARQRVSNLFAQAEAAEAIHVRGLDLDEVDRDDLRHLAAKTQLGEDGDADLATPAGRATALDRLGQLMIASDKVAPNACSATSLTAIALSRGTEGLRALARAAQADATTQEAATRLLARLDDPSLTLADVSDFIEGLYQGLQAQEDDGETGIRNRTLTAFFGRHQEAIGGLFEAGATLAAVDTDGDLSQDHFVAFILQEDGTQAVFDPWEQADGHHWVTDVERVGQYAQVVAATFGVAPAPEPRQ
jgi:hypothetical protein